MTIYECLPIAAGRKSRRFVFLAIFLLLAVQSGFSSGQKDGGASAQQESARPGTGGEQAATKSAEKTVLRIAALKGPSGFGMVRMFDKTPVLGSGIGTAFSAVPTPDVMIARILSGEVDIAALPTNVAAKLYSKGVPIVLGAVTGSGVLYMITKDPSITGIADLAGKTVHNTGKGSSPQFVLEYLLSANGLKPGGDVKTDYTYDHLELAQAFIAGRVEYAVLPEPFVTKALRAVPDARIALDLQQLWTETIASGGQAEPEGGKTAGDVTDRMQTAVPETAGTASYPMTVVVLRKSVVEKYPEAVERFLSAYGESISWLRDNPQAAGKLVERFGFGLNAAEAADAIPRCNIAFIPAREARRDVLAFLSVLLEFDPDSVGNVLPGEGFFYGN